MTSPLVQTWANGSGGGTPLSAARLTAIVDAINAAISAADAAQATANTANTTAAAAIPAATFTTKGDLIVRSSSAVVRLAVGTDGQVLTADAASAGGVKWATPATGGVPTSRTLTAGTGLTGGGDLTADRTFAVSYGTTAGTAAQGNDARLSDARTPTAHKTSHATGGSDALTPADIGAATTAQGTKADGAAQKASNLSDLASASSARTNLGLGTAATANTGTASGNVPLLNASGRLDVARLASGTPDGTKFVRDDGTLAVPAGSGGIPATISIAAATDKVTSATVNDDGSATSGWPNRWEWLFKPLAGTAQLVQWTNEYGELRGTPAKVNTVAARWFSKSAPGDTAHSGPVIEVQDDRTTRTSLWSVDGSGNMATAGNVAATGTVTGSNIGGKVTAGTSAPSSPAVGDVWIDTTP